MYNQMPNNYLGYGQFGQVQYRPESQQYNQMPAQPQLKGRPVSSIEEVRAAQVDFDGSLYIYKEEFDSVIEQLKNALNEPKAAPAATLKF